MKIDSLVQAAERKENPQTYYARDIKKGWVFEAVGLWAGRRFLATSDRNPNPNENMETVTLSEIDSLRAAGSKLPLWLDVNQKIRRFDPLTSQEIFPEAKTRKVTAKDIKPGDVFAWMCGIQNRHNPKLDGWNTCLCTRITADTVFGIYLSSLAYDGELQMLPMDWAYGLRLYPDAKLILGSPVMEIAEGEAK